MASNPFVQQGQAISYKVRDEIVNRSLNGISQNQIAREMKVAKSAIGTIIDKFLRRGNLNKKPGRNNTRTACTDDVVTYLEYSKPNKPSIMAKEIQRKLVENQVFLTKLP